MSRDMSPHCTKEVKGKGDALNAIDRDYAGDLSRTVAKKNTFNAQTFTRYICPHIVSRLPAASASLNTEPILKRVVPMNHTHTYTWGNRAQVEKYRSYPLTENQERKHFTVIKITEKKTLK